MPSDRGFAERWNRYASGEFGLPETEPPMCAYATRFEAWTAQLCRSLSSQPGQPTVEAIRYSRLLLVERFMEWRSAVPLSHRNRLGTTGHRCLFWVFEQAYELLKVAELSLSPPPLVLPTPPSDPRPVPQIAGIFIGEEEQG